MHSMIQPGQARLGGRVLHAIQAGKLALEAVELVLETERVVERVLQAVLALLAHLFVGAGQIAELARGLHNASLDDQLFLQVVDACLQRLAFIVNVVLQRRRQMRPRQRLQRRAQSSVPKKRGKRRRRRRRRR